LKRLVEQFKAVGIDHNWANLEEATALIGAHENLMGLYHISDAEPLNGTFDAVYFVETIEHLLDHHIELTMKKLWDLLKPGGVLICTTPHDGGLSEQEVFCPITRKTFNRYQHVRSFTKQSLRHEFEEHGFEFVHSFATEFSTRTFKAKSKARLRERLGRKNPHLVCVVRRPT